MGDLDRVTHYVFGQRPKALGGALALAVFTPQSNGWQCRSTLRDALNHDYVGCETFQSILHEWIPADLRRVLTTTSRAEALTLLQGSAPPVPSGRPTTHSPSEGERPVPFAEGDPMLAAGSAAERALRHLELGW